MTRHRLENRPIHLGLGATAVPQPEFPRDERAVWHTADIRGTAQGLFITAGEGTQHRPR